MNKLSSSCHSANTDIPDPLSPLSPIILRFWVVLRATSLILTELVALLLFGHVRGSIREHHL